MAEKQNKKLFTITISAIFAAIVVALQYTLGLITVSQVNLNFTLIPICVAGMLFGVIPGTITGAAFGTAVFIQCMTGLQGVFGTTLFNANPFFTFITCVVRGALTGLLVALIFKGFSKLIKKTYIASLITAMFAPVINTGLFIFFYATLFNGAMKDMVSASGASVMYFLFIGLTGFNFIFEFISSAVLTPPITAGLKKAIKH